MEPKSYKIRWVQSYRLNKEPTIKDIEMIARAMVAEIEELQRLEDSGYKEANEVINHIRSL